MTVKYNKISLKREYVRLAEKRDEVYDDRPMEGYVSRIQHLAVIVGENPVEVLKDCEEVDERDHVCKACGGEYGSHLVPDCHGVEEKAIRDVDDSVKKTHTFVHFKVLAMQHPTTGCIGFVMMGKVGFLYDVDVVNVLLNAKKRWNAGEFRMCCACYDDIDKLVGVSICHDKDNYSKKEARYNAYNLEYRPA
jgi:hypothetical protein